MMNRLEPKYYRITITGAVDNQSVELYAKENGDPEEFYADALPETKDQSIAIEQANMRFESVIRGLSTTIQPILTPSIVTTGRTATTAASSISFTVAYDRPEYLVTEDENVPGTYIGYGQEGSDATEALKRFIARQLIMDDVMNRAVYDPVGMTEKDVALGMVIEKVTATKLFESLALAEAAISVTEIPNLTD